MLLRYAREFGVDRWRGPRFLLYAATMELSRLGSLVERVAGRVPRRSPGSLEPPIFIVGHYRSGTTLLHKAMAADPRFASVDTFDLLLPQCPVWLKPICQGAFQAVATALRLKQPFFHDYPLRLEDPNEVEPLLLSLGSELSEYWGYLFPRQASELLGRWIEWPDESLRERWKEGYDAQLRRIASRARASPMVVKDPPNTARVTALLELYPGARFVHVVRDPLHVFLSMRRLWEETIQAYFSLQRIDRECIEAIVIEHYRLLMERWCEQCTRIPDGRLVEVRYEEFVQEPRAGLESVYAGLGLEGPSAEVSGRLERHRGYRPAVHVVDEKDEALVRETLGDWRQSLGYC